MTHIWTCTFWLMYKDCTGGEKVWELVSSSISPSRHKSNTAKSTKKTRPSMLLMPFKFQSLANKIKTVSSVITKHYMIVYFLTFKFSEVNSKCTSGLFSCVSLCCKECKCIFSLHNYRFLYKFSNCKPELNISTYHKQSIAQSTTRTLQISCIWIP